MKKTTFKISAVILMTAMLLSVFAGSMASVGEAYEETVYLPKTILSYNADGEWDGTIEYQYNENGQVTSKKNYWIDESGNSELWYFVEMEYGSDGNLIVYRAYNVDVEEPYVVYESRSIYENGMEVRSEEYDLIDGEFVLIGYYEFEYDGNGRLVKYTYSEKNDETDEFEIIIECVRSYKDDSEQLLSEQYVTLGNESDSWKTDYSYNEYGYVSEEFTEYENGTVCKSVYEYDESGKKLLKLLFYTDKNTGSLEYDGYDAYEY